MKLFAFQPCGHGPYSFFVLAKDEAAARAAVDDDIAKRLADGEFSDFDVYGWGTNNYVLTEAAPGVVLNNPNS